MKMHTVWTVVKDAATGFMDDKATRLSAAVAFYSILSIAPLFVIAVAIAGAVFGHDAATGALSDQLRGLVGDAGAQVAQTAVEHADKPKTGILASIIGIATLLLGASGVFGELQDALNTVWGVKPKPGGGIWRTIRTRFLSFGMVLVIGFLLLVSLVITTALSAAGKYVGDQLPGTPVLMHVVNFVVSYLVITLLFALIFKYLPDARISWRDVWFGALVTAGLFTLGKYLIGLYLGRAGVATPFGAAGSLVAFVVWLYYSGLIVFFGAELTESVARHAGRRIEPAADAEPAGDERPVDNRPSPPRAGNKRGRKTGGQVPSA
jgi:membrane protein